MVASQHGPQRGQLYFPIGSELDLDQSSFERAAETDEWSEALTYKERYCKSIGEARLLIGNTIRMMCRSPKSRAGCHFGAAIGLRSMLEDFTPTIPDWALDRSAHAGRTQAGARSRPLPQRTREADPAADR
jgi:hypothetical protein